VANENDDALDPAEIEALLNSAGGAGAAPPVPPAATGGAVDSGRTPVERTAAPAGQQLAGGDIDELLKEHSHSGTAGNPEALLESAAASLEAAIDPDNGPFGSFRNLAGGARPFEFQAFDRTNGSDTINDLGNLKDVELNLRIELGRTELLIEEVLKLREGSVVALDKLAGDPVDILVNGRLVARGEVLVLNDNFCVRVAEILAPALV
jgi:flagellar motor switch protein FliN/FliY